MNPQGHAALVTGGGSGLGAATAEKLAARGAKVALIDVNLGAAEAVAAKIGGLAIACDVTDDEAMAAAIGEANAKHGPARILVNCAGVGPAKRIVGRDGPMPLADFERVIKINLTANFRLIRAFDGMLRRSPAGRAIFVSSAAADGRHPYWGAYATSKGALETMVMTWAGELMKTNLKVNVINPGPTRTRMRGDAFPAENVDELKPPEATADAFVDLAEASSTRHGELVTLGR
jgi:NAD(P)-dependent dehydrogenase (short-subunit alcohol dehydrogenase family)